MNKYIVKTAKGRRFIVGAKDEDGAKRIVERRIETRNPWTEKVVSVWEGEPVECVKALGTTF